MQKQQCVLLDVELIERMWETRPEGIKKQFWISKLIEIGLNHSDEYAS